MVRYFCVVGPTGLAISDLGFGYLREMVDQRVRVRALPIGASGAFCTEKRWYELGEAFTRPMALPFLNVICARCGDTLGHKTSASKFSGSDGLPSELRAVLGPMAGKAPDIEYVPQTVFAGLYTVGVKNVAIVTGIPDDAEAAVLQHYSAVICPDRFEHEQLAARGVQVTTATDFVGLLQATAGVELTDSTPVPLPLAEAPTEPATIPFEYDHPGFFRRLWGRLSGSPRR